MRNLRWFFALPLALAFAMGSADASSIRDNAGLFDPNAVREAEAKLDQIERETGVTTTIETIDSLQGRSLDSVAEDHARRSKTEGIYTLITRQEHKLETLVSPHYTKAFPRERRLAIRDAFLGQFKKGDFDAGLKDGVQAVDREVKAARSELGGHLRRAEGAPAPVHGRQVARQRGGNGFGLGSLLGIGLLIVAVLVGIRLLGSLFGGGAGAGVGPGMGRPGYGPGPGYGAGVGPGYGGGYGGRGGGFMSSLFGGIGGALAGNWLYDQFSGRHHGSSYADNTAYQQPSEAAPTNDAGNDDWAGGGSEAGDWGGGDGGGDWGGGGGGDWGGGGGGDWGGGGGDGGSW